MPSPAAPETEPKPSSTQADAPSIVFEDVSISFDEKEVLNGVSFKLDRGATKAIFGVAGSGKSTILKLALGLLKPDAGKIQVMGEDVTTMSEKDLFELRRKVGIVFQESALFDSLDVRENVGFRLLEEGNVSDDDIEKRVKEALSFVEMEKTVDLFPAELSGGMRRRVAIARAIITEPEIILYDSPTGGLDPVTSTTIVDLMMKQRDIAHTSALLVTHRLQDAFVMASHFYDRKKCEMLPLSEDPERKIPMTFLILNKGKVIFDGDVHELAQDQDEYIRTYIS